MKNIKHSLLLVTIAAASGLVGCVNIERHNHASIEPYPLKTCAVSGEAFTHGTPVTFVHSGHEVKLCCSDCRAEFDKNPGKYLAKLHK